MRIVRASEVAALSEEDIEVVSLVAQGKTNIQISNELGYSFYTIRRRMERLFKKTQTKNRAQLVSVVIEAGVIQPGRLSR